MTVMSDLTDSVGGFPSPRIHSLRFHQYNQTVVFPDSAVFLWHVSCHVSSWQQTMSSVVLSTNTRYHYDREVSMKIYLKGMVARLHGDLTHSGVTRSIINSLAVILQKTVSGGETNLRIDCSKVRSADISGLQLLYVWMQCARFRGVEPELVNLPRTLQLTMEMMGLGHCFTGDSVIRI